MAALAWIFDWSWSRLPAKPPGQWRGRHALLPGGGALPSKTREPAEASQPYSVVALADGLSLSRVR